MEALVNNTLTIAKSDHDLLMHYLRTNNPELRYDQKQAEQLLEKVKTAQVVNNSDFPKEMIRLNSKITVRNTLARQNHSYKLVLPNEADHKHDKISVLAPIGCALLGFSKGDTITLRSARGSRYYTVLEVSNPVD